MMRNALMKTSVLALVLLMALAPVASLAGAEDVQEDMEVLLETTEPTEDIDMVEELSTAATTWPAVTESPALTLISTSSVLPWKGENTGVPLLGGGAAAFASVFAC